MLTKLKERVQQLMIGEARLVHSIGLTPNQVSFIAIVAALFSAYSYSNSESNDAFLIAGAMLLLISGFLDALDGVVARVYGQVTQFGGFLDSLLDRYADASVLIGIILGWLIKAPQMWLLAGLVALIGSLLVSYSRARAEAAGIKMETVGLAERAERIMILVLGSFLSLAWQDALRWSVVILAVLTNATVVQRVTYFRKSYQKKEGFNDTYRLESGASPSSPPFISSPNFDDATMYCT